MVQLIPRILGKTGLSVGPLGVSGGYGAPAPAFEEAFERGCNYFYWGSRRKKGMREAIKNILRQGKRDKLIILIQSYSRSAFLMDVFFQKARKDLGIDYADILLLGFHNRPPAQALVDKALEMKEKGYSRFLGISSHNRSLFPMLAKQKPYDLFHMRYNAAHRGAETEAFPYLKEPPRPGIVCYTATRWGTLLKSGKMPNGMRPPSASDCYRFVLTNPAVDVCMCGPRDSEQMKEALRALDRGRMSPEELEYMIKVGDYVHAHAGTFFKS